MDQEYSLQKAADTLVLELFEIRPGETFVITTDTESDERVVEATARAAASAGAKVMVVVIPAPHGVSLAADPMLPVESLIGILKHADAWAEFNKKWLLYSTPYNETMKQNQQIRHMCLTGATVSTMVNCVGKVNYPVLKQFGDKLTQKIIQAKQVRMTSSQGEDISFENVAGRPVFCDLGYANDPGTHMLAGQISWTPDLESINGVIVLDGSIAPGIGLVKRPVKICVRNGVITSIEGGQEAKMYEQWLRGFNHPQMLSVAHTGLGFNPGAMLWGDIIQDQRVWGSTTWGFGSIGPDLFPPSGKPGPSHSDAVSLNTSIILNGNDVIKEGEVIDDELKGLASQLKRVG
ncbi:leucyl aminopeptidase [Candidatus Formimonas warabiya]|uniref:Leucyl aminopeptidase n=2 Tax=Formimonas warabiya TaxID=1761012 RepID=A0A3G1KQ93_FORW1|nr:aminopeptidase [Candidatus Formimonas warabiya]ATW24643.1 leucyl aminopeptidase [Candidatus Formimonas warabiya]